MRTCDITGETMQEGYYIEFGEITYIKHEKDLLKHLRDIEKESNDNYDEEVRDGHITDEFLLDEYYEEEYYCWTDWYDEE